jgi:DNA-binding LytR/AlgR family response regulator
MLDGKKDTVTQNLGKLADKFSFDNFVRVSRKSIVNTNFLKKLNKQTGELELEFNGQNLKINTSKKYFQHSHFLN